MNNFLAAFITGAFVTLLLRFPGFWLRVARLFVTIVGFLAFLFLTALILDSAYFEWSKPVYRPAASAVYYYQPGTEASDFMTGAVELAIERGFPIDMQRDKVDTPSLCFYDENGDMIVESQMYGLWSLYDVSVRFGVEPYVPRCPFNALLTRLGF